MGTYEIFRIKANDCNSTRLALLRRQCNKCYDHLLCCSSTLFPLPLAVIKLS